MFLTEFTFLRGHMDCNVLCLPLSILCFAVTVLTNVSGWDEIFHYLVSARAT